MFGITDCSASASEMFVVHVQDCCFMKIIPVLSGFNCLCTTRTGLDTNIKWSKWHPEVFTNEQQMGGGFVLRGGEGRVELLSSRSP